jgi:hypothetical protein
MKIQNELSAMRTKSTLSIQIARTITARKGSVHHSSAAGSKGPNRHLGRDRAMEFDYEDEEEEAHYWLTGFFYTVEIENAKWQTGISAQS